MGKGISLFKRPGPVDPKTSEAISRAIREMMQRINPRRDPPPVPPPPLPDTKPPEPQKDKPRDPRTDECVGDCEEKERCPEKKFCFNKEKFAGTHKDKVYDAYLNVQQAEMRTMTPTQVLGNRALYESRGRSYLENLPGVQDSRNDVIDRWQVINPGQDWRAQGLEALHRLDMGAGGDPSGYYAMGDKSINRSIGGGWPSKTEQLKQHARNLQANGCQLMKVRFDSSPFCVPDKIPASGYPE